MADVIIRPLDIHEDAQSLADMWNESDLQWPGSWNEGIPTDAEQMLTWARDRRNLAVFVAEDRGKIVGYCSFTDEHGDHTGEGYLALLNVHPAYQGRSIGRRLIQATIERSVQEGFARQTLGTWSANFKAVPTYKKTGHFWAPDTSVWMQNYVPGALSMSLAKPFFERHNWYTSYARGLEHGEDGEIWEGLEVFTQRWEAGGEALTIRIDRAARAPVAIETDEVTVAAIVAVDKPLAGSEVGIRWRVANKTDSPLHIHIHALGDKGLEIDHREAVTVGPSATVERQGTVKVASDASARKDDGTAPAVRSIVRIGDDEVELFSGLRPRKPLSLNAWPEHISIPVGRPANVDLQLHSEYDAPVRARIVLTPPEGLEPDWRIRDVEIEAHGHVTVPIELIAAEECVYDVPLRLTAEPDRVAAVTETLTVFALHAGGLLFHDGDGGARLETDHLRVTLSSKGGSIKIEDKRNDLNCVELYPQFGPPFHPSEFARQTFALRLEQRGTRVVAKLSGECRRTEGLCLVQDIALSATGLLTMALHLENTGKADVQGQLRLRAQKPTEDDRIILPLREATVESLGSAYPAGYTDAPRSPQAYAEPWVAWSRRGMTTGIAWDDQTAEIELGWQAAFTSRELRVPSGSRSETVRYAVHAAPQPWTSVSSVLRGWAGRCPESEPCVRPPQWASAEPAVALTLEEDVDVRIVAHSVSARSERGTLTVSTGAGLGNVRHCTPVEGLRRGQPVESILRFPVPSVGAHTAQLELSLESSQFTSSFPIVRLGSKGTVRVEPSQREGRDVWEIDNGRSLFVVAPSFGPSVIAWERDGANLLHSPFPERGALSWTYPFFGGHQMRIMPKGSHVWEGYLYREEPTARPFDTIDAQGIVWQGVRVEISPQKEELRGFHLSVDWLTAPDSDVLRAVYRVRNLWATAQRVHIGTDLALSFGGDLRDVAVYADGLARQPTVRGAFIQGQRWGALCHPGTGMAALLTSSREDVAVFDAGQDGRILGSEQDLRLDRDETIETVYHIVVAENLEAAMGYLALKDV